MTIIYRITTPNACFAIFVTDGIVTKAAPIAAWAVGKTWYKVGDYFRRKGATVERLK